jgi:hypothetical protein
MVDRSINTPFRRMKRLIELRFTEREMIVPHADIDGPLAGRGIVGLLTFVLIHIRDYESFLR